MKTKLLVTVVLGLVVIQFVPYGRNHANPPLQQEPAWDAPGTREFFSRACGDCHSNETIWPSYSNVAPVSWLVQHDVEHGRKMFNVSEWGRSGKNKGNEAAEQFREGEMPPWFYMPLHSQARLKPEERKQLAAGLIATFGEEL